MSALGGAERVCVHAMKGLVQDNHDICLLTDPFDRSEVRRRFGISLPPVKIAELDGDWEPNARFRSFVSYQNMLHSYFNDRRLKRFIEPDNYDLILGTKHPMYVLNSKRPTIQYCHYPWGFIAKSSAKFPTIRRLYLVPVRAWIEGKLRSIDLFLANSEFTRKAIRRLWHQDSLTIYPPCDVSGLKPSVNKKDVVLSVGRITEEKRYELMFGIARQLPTVDFRILGGLAAEKLPYYSTLLSEKPPNVKILVDVSLASLKAELAEAKVYLHLMENEHFGISIVEAMASGCVPVVHESGGPIEIVNEDSGYKWQVPNQAVLQIKTLLGNNNLFEAKSKAAARRAALFDSRVFEERIREVVKGFMVGQAANKS